MTDAAFLSLPILGAAASSAAALFCLRFHLLKASEIRMDEGDMYESEVITFVAPKKSGWLKKKSTGTHRC